MDVQNNEILIQKDTFAVLDNYQDSRSTSDLFYVNIDEISSVENFIGTDGFYKLLITFSDGKVLEMSYLTEERMNHDLSLIAPDSGIEPEDSDDSEDSDASDDSEEQSSGSDSEHQTPTFVYCSLTGYGVNYTYPTTNAYYWLYASTTTNIHYENEEEVEVTSGSDSVVVEGRDIYANIFYKIIYDDENPSQDYYVFSGIHIYTDWIFAVTETPPEGFMKITKQVSINTYPTSVDEL